MSEREIYLEERKTEWKTPIVARVIADKEMVESKFLPNPLKYIQDAGAT